MSFYFIRKYAEYRINFVLNLCITIHKFSAITFAVEFTDTDTCCTLKNALREESDGNASFLR